MITNYREGIILSSEIPQGITGKEPIRIQAFGVYNRIEFGLKKQMK
jgi:hypothetical protein